LSYVEHGDPQLGPIVRGLAAALNDGESVNGSLGGHSALHLGILNGHVEICRYLARCGANVSAADRQGDLPIHLCALARILSDESAVQVARSLLEHGAQPDAVNARGETASDLAQMREKPLLYQLLKDS